MGRGQAPAALLCCTPRMHPPLLLLPLAADACPSTPRQVARLHSLGPGTMPATWAELRGCLAALLDHLATPSSTVVDDERVMGAIKRWQALAADLPPLPPDDQERTELLG